MREKQAAPARPEATARTAPVVEKDGGLRRIPAVEKILSSSFFTPAIGRFGRDQTKKKVVALLDAIRGGGGSFGDMESFAQQVELSLSTALAPSLRRVVNGTGVIIHTNLGRAPLDPALVVRAMERVETYSNLEFDLESGERGSRSGHLESVCRELFGCEAAVLTNNNAAATLLVMAAVAAGREVIVSRGELVEIGGAFRVPDVIQQGGARLREVGTTNKTRSADYAEAISRRTAAILKVHRSNFEIVGFTESATIGELVKLAHARKLPLLYDEGSGRVVDLEPYGFGRELTLRELIAAGVDIVTCSTDKLIGGTQGGLILGRADLVRKCAKHPLMRALRAGKESFAVIGETLQSFVRQSHDTDIPIYRLLSASVTDLGRRAAVIASATGATVTDLRSALGGGTTPSETIASAGVKVAGDAVASHRALLRRELPVVGRIEDDALVLDLRTVLPEEDEEIIAALRELPSERT